MTNEELRNHVKSALRILTDDIGINSEVNVLIESAKMDLQMSGIKVSTVNELGETTYDDVIVLAITLYCKAKFGFDNPESEKLYESYRMLETHLALSTEYKEVIQ